MKKMQSENKYTKNKAELVVFVAYEHKDGSVGGEQVVLIRDHMIRALENEGIVAWSDQELSASDVWRSRIKASISKCHLFIAIVGDRILSGANWTLNEFEWANERCKPIAVFSCASINSKPSPISKYPPFQYLEIPSERYLRETPDLLRSRIESELKVVTDKLVARRLDMSIIRDGFEITELKSGAFRIKIERNVSEGKYEVRIGNIQESIFPNWAELSMVFLYKLAEVFDEVREKLVQIVKLNKIEPAEREELALLSMHECFRDLEPIDDADWMFEFFIQVESRPNKFLKEQIDDLIARDVGKNIKSNSWTKSKGVRFNRLTTPGEIALHIEDVLGAKTGATPVEIQKFLDDLISKLLDENHKFDRCGKPLSREGLWRLANNIICCGYQPNFSKSTPQNNFYWFMLVDLMSREMCSHYLAYLCGIDKFNIDFQEFIVELKNSAEAGTSAWLTLCVLSAEFYFQNCENIQYAVELLNLAKNICSGADDDLITRVKAPNYLMARFHRLGIRMGVEAVELRLSRDDNFFIQDANIALSKQPGELKFLVDSQSIDYGFSYGARAAKISNLHFIGGVSDNLLLALIRDSTFPIWEQLLKSGKIPVHSVGIARSSLNLLLDPSAFELAIRQGKNQRMLYMISILNFCVLHPKESLVVFAKNAKMKLLSRAVLEFIGDRLDLIFDEIGCGDICWDYEFLALLGLVFARDGNEIYSQKMKIAREKILKKMTNKFHVDEYKKIVQCLMAVDPTRALFVLG